MKELSLPHGLVALIDDEDYHIVKQHSWWVSKNGYVMARIGSRVGSADNRKNVYLHRFILDAPKEMQVDHINGCKLDNRRENLRFATWSENQRNSRTPKNNTSGYKGVSWDKSAWCARIRVNNKTIWLGRFKTPEEAAIAYNTAAMLYHKDFALLNEVK